MLQGKKYWFFILETVVLAVLRSSKSGEDLNCQGGEAMHRARDFLPIIHCLQDGTNLSLPPVGPLFFRGRPLHGLLKLISRLFVRACFSLMNVTDLKASRSCCQLLDSY